MQGEEQGSREASVPRGSGRWQVATAGENGLEDSVDGTGCGFCPAVTYYYAGREKRQQGDRMVLHAERVEATRPLNYRPGYRLERE